jgi:hypothetical protein
MPCRSSNPRRKCRDDSWGSSKGGCDESKRHLKGILKICVSFRSLSSSKDVSRSWKRRGRRVFWKLLQHSSGVRYYTQVMKLNTQMNAAIQRQGANEWIEHEFMNVVAAENIIKRLLLAKTQRRRGCKQR